MRRAATTRRLEGAGMPIFFVLFFTGRSEARASTIAAQRRESVDRPGPGARPSGNMAAMSSGYGAACALLAPPDVHLVGTGTHPVLQRRLSRDDGARKASKRSGRPGPRLLGRDMGHHWPPDRLRHGRSRG